MMYPTRAHVAAYLLGASTVGGVAVVLPIDAPSWAAAYEAPIARLGFVTRTKGGIGCDAAVDVERTPKAGQDGAPVAIDTQTHRLPDCVLLDDIATNVGLQERAAFARMQREGDRCRETAVGFDRKDEMGSTVQTVADIVTSCTRLDALASRGRVL